ncbi:26S proteasome regulatory subunit 10B A [Stylosanthes scabra]|uniref:26S proteasome regulatory subunit 10B A n=1 Tax=Stylosanthes scabra TaxID=79078 RepID=A0ABU6VD83_9FABA|nr:26S proteasome regulatory subunit 10B A [Stylosanthes scabra]
MKNDNGRTSLSIFTSPSFLAIAPLLLSSFLTVAARRSSPLFFAAASLQFLRLTLKRLTASSSCSPTFLSIATVSSVVVLCRARRHCSHISGRCSPHAEARQCRFHEFWYVPPPFPVPSLIVKASSGPKYVVGCCSKVDKEKLTSGTRVVLDMTTLTIMRALPREVDPVVYNMLHEDPGNVSYSAVGGLSDQIR